MKKFAVPVLLSCCLLSSAAFNLSSAAPLAAPKTMEELKAERLRLLAKRDPRTSELMTKAQARIDKLKEANSAPALALRLQKILDRIVFGTAGVSDLRLKADVELLEAIAKDHKEPSADELAPLQDRYRKICARFDDMAFHKDLDRAFHIHDKLVRFTALGLWDKDKISAELERIEGLVERAPDIPFGRSQLLDTCKNKKLASVPKLVYLGSSSQEEMYLTADRRSVAVLDEGCGQGLHLELAEHLVQGPDGKLTDLNQCNDPSLGLPFSPPLSLWAKARMLEGRVPAVLFKLVDSRSRATNPEYAGSKSASEFISVADVASGKLDDYFKKNLPLLGIDKTPVMVGLFSDFDREAAATAFGADGHANYYDILDPKLKEMPEDKRKEELEKRYKKGVYNSPKSNSAELSNQYGDAAIPDGPERVRDSWKRLAKLVKETGSSSVCLFSSAGSFHGNKNAGKYEAEEQAGNQCWNKLEYYWPGEGVLDWVGINAVGSDPVENPKSANLMEALDSFMAEVRSSTWQSTPVMLVNLAPARNKTPLAESAWITTVFTKLIPGTFPNILAVFINVLDDVTLWSSDSKSAFRNFVSSNKAYNYKLKFKNLDAPPGSEQGAKTPAEGKTAN